MQSISTESGGMPSQGGDSGDTIPDLVGSALELDEYCTMPPMPSFYKLSSAASMITSEISEVSDDGSSRSSASSSSSSCSSTSNSSSSDEEDVEVLLDSTPGSDRPKSLRSLGLEKRKSTRGGDDSEDEVMHKTSSSILLVAYDTM